MEAIGAHGGGLSGIPTGFAKFDDLTNGLHGGQMVIIAAHPAMGKQHGWVTVLHRLGGQPAQSRLCRFRHCR